MEGRDEEVIHPTTGGLSSRSSLSSSHASSHSWRQDSSFDYRDFPPQSEVEEIPSKRWLSPSLRWSLFIPSRGRSARSSPTVQPAAVGLGLAGSDWEQRLPPDYKQILARATSPVEASSYQELYYRLCASILIDDGNKSFSIDEMTGKKCYMLSARDLEFQNHSPLWIATSLPSSPFSEVAQLELRDSSGALCIVGKMDVKDLSPQTTYAAHLVYKPLSWYTFLESRLPHRSFRASITVVPQASTSRRRSLISEEGKVMSRRFGRGGWMEKAGDFVVDVGQQPHWSPDQWVEAELGDLVVHDGHRNEVALIRADYPGATRGLIVQGIDVRPKRVDHKGEPAPPTSLIRAEYAGDTRGLIVQGIDVRPKRVDHKGEPAPPTPPIFSRRDPLLQWRIQDFSSVGSLNLRKSTDQ